LLPTGRFLLKTQISTLANSHVTTVIMAPTQPPYDPGIFIAISSTVQLIIEIVTKS